MSMEIRMLLQNLFYHILGESIAAYAGERRNEQ